ncbi:type VII secretion integral membrane protein EccD [Lentzea sp. DG1S-22]|uniref:type VII secretion integral membrane protein EccD n=1 Tax=Lentzea sp. DG1S-22 TaxID=3108822 RepID=UPI002E7939FF|nr:type VII secretion integral membrane protein EccD [Lentzea sp. DG1S-22]WVH82391.1 type VII secretion integral membrane protein EccD [Lentzea sp. DG1S-22]
MATIPPSAAMGSGEMCRLTICGPTSRVELAVPAHVPIADLMPTVLGHLDPALATSGLAHGGWVLQRLGEPPLDEDQGTAASGLFDGDLLHLRPRDDLLPLVDFDDLVDGVHTGLSRKQDLWTPALTRYTGVALMAVFAVVAVVVASFADSGLMASISAGAVACCLLVMSAVAAHARDDRVSALVLGAVAVCAAAVAGLAVPMGGAPPQHWFTAPGVFAAAFAVAVTAMAVRAVTGAATEVALAVVVAALLVCAGGAVTMFGGLSGPGSAAIVVTAALLLTKAAPSAAARLAGLAVEPVPTTADEFQEGLDPLPSGDVLDRADSADRYLTGFLSVLGLVLAGGLVVVAAHTSWDASVFAAVVSVLLLLHARELSSVWHRLTALVPAVAGLVSTACVRAAGGGPVWWTSVLLGLLLVAGAAFACAQVLPGRKLVPRWGRWGDLLHWACALATIPLVLSLTGVYGVISSIF